MLSLILAAAIAAAPTPSTKAGRLAQYILRIHPRSTVAAQLAVAIITEAKRHKLDPALLAAIAHNESHFRLTAKGTWFERGVFQLWPWAPYLGVCWAAYVKATGGNGWPTGAWKAIPRKVKDRIAMDVFTAAYLAAHVLAFHLKLCGRQTPRCAAAYNSGNWRLVRPGYLHMLRQRARAIRAILTRP